MIEFGYLILIVGAIFIILMFWRSISMIRLKHKYSNVITCLITQGYGFYRKFNSKGRGLVYRKSIDKEIIDSLLLRYKYSPIELDGEFEIFDYAAILKFPEWNEGYSSVVCDHGGIRLFHFYTLEIKRGEKYLHRHLGHYLDNDLGGEALAPIDLECKEIVHSMLSSGIKDAIEKFNDELEYWIKQ